MPDNHALENIMHVCMNTMNLSVFRVLVYFFHAMRRQIVSRVDVKLYAFIIVRVSFSRVNVQSRVGPRDPPPSSFHACVRLIASL